MRRENSTATPALYDGIASTPGPITDSPDYNKNSLNDPACTGQNYAAQAGLMGSFVWEAHADYTRGNICANGLAAG